MSFERFFFFSLLCTKTLKRIQNILYRQTKHFQTRVYWLFWDCYIPERQNAYIVTKRHHQQSIIWVCFSVSVIKTLKSLEKLHMRKQNNIIKKKKKTCLLKFFELMYQNAKMRSTHLLWRNRTTLPKTCVMCVFHLVRYQNDKMNSKEPICGNETILTETCINSVFQLLR